MARLAAVCRSSWGYRSGMPMLTAAAVKALRKVVTRRGWPLRIPPKTRSSGFLPATWRARSATRKEGADTSRRWWVFGVAPHHPETLQTTSLLQPIRAAEGVGDAQALLGIPQPEQLLPMPLSSVTADHRTSPGGSHSESLTKPAGDGGQQEVGPSRRRRAVRNFRTDASDSSRSARGVWAG